MEPAVLDGAAAFQGGQAGAAEIPRIPFTSGTASPSRIGRSRRASKNHWPVSRSSIGHRWRLRRVKLAGLPRRPRRPSQASPAAASASTGWDRFTSSILTGIRRETGADDGRISILYSLADLPPWPATIATDRAVQAAAARISAEPSTRAGRVPARVRRPDPGNG